jgi:hypothetical protein
MARVYVLGMSTNKEGMPVVGVSNVEYPNGELAARLATAFGASSTESAT